MSKFLAWVFGVIAFCGVIFILWHEPKPIIKTVTTTEPGWIIYRPGPQPTPRVVEKIVYRDGQMSFKQDLPYHDKQIVTESAIITFNGQYRVSMEDNLVSVSDEIIGNVEVKYTFKTKPPPMSEAGIYISSQDGLGVYFRRHFNPVWMITPWAEIRASMADFDKTEITAGLPVKF